MHEACDPAADEKKLELEQQQRERAAELDKTKSEWVSRYFARTAIESQVIPVSPMSPRKRKPSSTPSASKLAPKDPQKLATHTPDPTSAWRFQGRYWSEKSKAEFGSGPTLW
eukprot:m.112124 g.112124  ORF g.112124 m.112124 type:complete len:112 (-) comp10771_c0_seq2:197-532(-)